MACRRALIIPSLIFISSPFWSAPALAQSIAVAPPPPAEGTQAPPLFPKHRRGLYKNRENVDVIDATPQSPPLNTDDPGVPRNGEFEINLLAAADGADGSSAIDVLRVDANYGLVLKPRGFELPAQVKVEFPISAAHVGSAPYQVGLGTAAVGLKVNFYDDENHGVSLAAYPQVELSTARSVAKGIAEEGQALVLPLLIAKEFAHVTTVYNAGLELPFHADGRANSVELGAGVGRALFRKIAVMGELRSSSNVAFTGDRLVSANLGAIYGVRKAIWYLRVGHTLFSDNGPHAFFAVGIKVFVDTKSGR
jgi:hypothetical protein